MTDPKPCLRNCRWTDPPGPARYIHAYGCPNAEAAEACEHPLPAIRNLPIRHCLLCGKPAPAPVEAGEVNERARTQIALHAQCREIEAGLRAEVERLKAGSNIPYVTESIDNLRAELAQAKEEIAKLREVLKAAVGHCDCADYNGKALIPCTKVNPCAGCYMTMQISAILARQKEESRG